MKNNKSKLMPMNLQLFAESGEGNTEVQTGQSVQATSSNQGIDYDKIQSIIDGRTAKTEQSILKDYFSKQGLSEEDMKSAIDTYKASKQEKVQAQSQEFTNLQTKVSTYEQQIKQYQINDTARELASDLGVENKTLPYLIKMADLSNSFNDKGEIDKEVIKNALSQVLDDIPSLKASATENKGFVKVGADTKDETVVSNDDDFVKRVMGLK